MYDFVPAAFVSSFTVNFQTASANFAAESASVLVVNVLPFKVAVKAKSSLLIPSFVKSRRIMYSPEVTLSFSNVTGSKLLGEICAEANALVSRNPAIRVENFLFII